MSPRILLTHGVALCAGASIVWFAPRSETGGSAAADGGNAGARPGTRTASAVADGDVSAASRLSRTGGPRAGSKAKDPGTLLPEIVRSGDPLERQEALIKLLAGMAPEDFPAFAEQFRQLDHFADSHGEYEMILRAWAKVDPLGALEVSSNRPDGGWDTRTLLAAWAGNDAAAAEQWALSHHEGDGPNPYLTAVIRGLAAYDVNRASELAATMPRSRERGEAMDAVTRALFVQGADAAMAFPATLDDPDLRGGYVSMISDRLARKDAETAATWLASMNDGEAQRRGARTIASALAQKDVREASQWVAKLDPAAQAEAARGVIVPMSNGDIQGTARWVSTLSGVPGYDSVVEEFVWSCDVRDPEQSAAWIQAISDEAQQARLYHRMLGGWSNRDDAAVRDWVAANNANLPNSVRNRFKK
ncbi:MAG: hypothetical protein H7A48_08450 [Akkermansiaceae bacterium]|nr:hypothetical protein [Akkermansiaceae bacterium]